MANTINLAGDWEVRITQKLRPKQLKYNLTCMLTHVEDRVLGVLIYDLGNISYDFKSALKDRRTTRLQLRGRLQRDKLQLQYESNFQKAPQYGSMILEITSGDSMKGLFIGYGPESDGLISGKVEFRKR
jgi:hypothetical protein